MNFYSKAAELYTSGTAFVVVTMVTTRGYAPQDPGAKMIVTREGLVFGTVGGGRVEAKAIAHAQETLSSSNARTYSKSSQNMELVTWNLQRDVGMSCGGEVQYLFERVEPNSWKIAVFGAGHVAQALIRQLLALECQVICIDNRPEWIERLPQNSPQLKAIRVQDYSDALSELPRDAYCVVMTRGHATDLPVLEKILKTWTPPYIGVIGSDVKGIKIRKDLQDLGVNATGIEALRCPMGLSIGNRNHPGEIAISIAAELIQVRSSEMSKTH